MSFRIEKHAEEAIIEVVYPAEPASHDVVVYMNAMKRTIDEQHGPWKCLVDQSGLSMIQPALVEKLSFLNKYAQSHGMLKSARIVASQAAALQARRLAEQAGVANIVRTFTTRDEAWAWLLT